MDRRFLMPRIQLEGEKSLVQSRIGNRLPRSEKGRSRQSPFCETSWVAEFSDGIGRIVGTDYPPCPVSPKRGANVTGQYFAQGLQ
jgi:hypothetical protein